MTVQYGPCSLFYLAVEKFVQVISTLCAVHSSRSRCYFTTQAHNNSIKVNTLNVIHLLFVIRIIVIIMIIIIAIITTVLWMFVDSTVVVNSL